MHFVTEEHLAWVELWRLCQGGDLSAGLLPFSGGVAEQPCYTMECFSAIGWAVAQLRAKPSR